MPRSETTSSLAILALSNRCAMPLLPTSLRLNFKYPSRLLLPLSVLILMRVDVPKLLLAEDCSTYESATGTSVAAGRTRHETAKVAATRREAGTECFGVGWRLDFSAIGSFIRFLLVYGTFHVC